MSDIKFSIEGMSCAACAATVEKAAKSCAGVENAEVQLLANRLTVKTADGTDKESVCQAVCQAVQKAGYTASLGQKKEKSGESAKLKRRFILSLCLMLPLTAIAMLPMYLPMPDFLEKYYFILPAGQIVLAALALVLHRKYLQTGFARLLHLAPSMESLISVGVGASVLYSLYEFYRISSSYI